MQVICLEEEALIELVDRVSERLMPVKPWIGKEEAMKELEIKSATTLQRLRDENKIRFSQENSKGGNIVYHRQSIYDYLERHANMD